MVEWDEKGRPTRMIGTHTDIRAWGGEDAAVNCRLTLVAASQGEPSASMAIITDTMERKEIERVLGGLPILHTAAQRHGNRAVFSPDDRE
ncbi:hypothetical protein K0651_01370 [Ornithinimicrobium sp. Arc0846-15]|nr:hypothetical protein [Ornithinimicrobium laminariae]